MRTLEKYRKVNHRSQLPGQGTYIILTQSTNFLGKAIQGFMRLWQWVRGDRDTDLIPNHADGLKDGYAIGALVKGVEGHIIDRHFQENAEFYIVQPILSDAELERFWGFLKAQEGEKYRYLDIIRYAFMTITNKWFGRKESLDRKKWTCYSLVASAYNYAVQNEYFKDPFNITPYEVCVQFDRDYGMKFE